MSQSSEIPEKPQLVIIRAKVGEQIKTFIQRPVRLCVVLINLVKHDNRPQPQRQRL